MATVLQIRGCDDYTPILEVISNNKMANFKLDIQRILFTQKLSADPGPDQSWTLPDGSDVLQDDYFLK